MKSTHCHLIFACVIRNDMVTETLEVQGQLGIEKVYRNPLHRDEVEEESNKDQGSISYVIDTCAL